MRSLYYITVFASAICLTVLPAVYFGNVQHRWGEPAELEAAVRMLAGFPKIFGEWECTEERDLGDDARKLLQARGSIVRSYRHRTSKRIHDVIILVGRPGPIVRHPPEFCYDVRGNVAVGDSTPITISVSGKEHVFKMTEFRQPDVVDSRFLVCTAWSDGERFETSDHPRTRFGSEPFIYAIQVLARISGEGDRAAAAASVDDFLAGLLAKFPAY